MKQLSVNDTRGFPCGYNQQFKFESREGLTPTTIEDLIQNPSTHYDKGDGTNYVPIASTGDLTKDWWNPLTKTIYDPCPNGYRIPESGAYGEASDWTKSNPYSGLTSGYNWKSSFFPASGNRNPVSGMFGSVGSAGYASMSTPHNPANGKILVISPTTAAPNNYSARSSNHPTRCIAEQPVIPTDN